MNLLIRTSLVPMVLSAVAWCQVAANANAGYKTREGREAMARVLDSPGRDAQEKPHRLVSELGLKPGMTVADVGTGVGYMLPYLSPAVGPAGKVVAEDIHADFLSQAKATTSADHLTNVNFVLGTATDPMLPAGAIDVALVLDAYHHFDYPGKMLANIAKGLKGAGRLVVVDYYKRWGAMGPGGQALEHIRLDRGDVIKEIEANGFQLVSVHDHIPNSQYMAIFRKK